MATRRFTNPFRAHRGGRRRTGRAATGVVVGVAMVASVAAGGDARPGDASVLYLVGDGPPPATAEADDFRGLLGELDRLEESSTDRFVLRGAPVGERRGVFVGTIGGPIDEFQFDLYPRSFPGSSDATFLVQVVVAGTEVFHGGVDALWQRHDFPDLVDGPLGHWSFRVVDLLEAPDAEVAGIAGPGPHQVSIAIGLGPTPFPVGAQVIGIDRRATPSRVVVNPVHPRRHIPAASAAGGGAAAVA